MPRKSETLVILNSKQKSLCQLATTEFFPKETKNRETERKLQKHVWVLCVRLVVLICLGLVVLSPSNWNIKHYKSLDILSNFQNVKSPCVNVIPPIKDFLETVLIWTSHHFARRFLYVWFFAVWKCKEHANREPSSSTSWVRFTWRVLFCVCEIFTAVVSEPQRGPHVLL